MRFQTRVFTLFLVMAILTSLIMAGFMYEPTKHCPLQRFQADEEFVSAQWGINTDLAIVGNIGSKQRMEFTAIGDSINLAARLEQATPDHGVDILVSEYTDVAPRSRFPFEPAREISLEGKTESVRTYTIRKLA